MKKLEAFEIPDEIRDIEFHNDTTKFKYFNEILQKARTEENHYVAAFTAMIQMDEAANSKHVEKLDFKNVPLFLCSRIEQKFYIESKERNNLKAYNETDGFTIRKSSSKAFLGAGYVTECRGNKVIFKITQGLTDILSSYNEESTYFDLKFFTNSLVYQVLHNALYWFKKHKLFDVLNDEQYDRNFDHSTLKASDQIFHSPFSEKLNEEQKNAVQHILLEPKQSIPYILHGPPGRIKSILIIIFYFIN